VIEASSTSRAIRKSAEKASPIAKSMSSAVRIFALDHQSQPRCSIRSRVEVVGFVIRA
jgi:hypothetical protein